MMDYLPGLLTLIGITLFFIIGINNHPWIAVFILFLGIIFGPYLIDKIKSDDTY